MGSYFMADNSLLLLLSIACMCAMSLNLYLNPLFNLLILLFIFFLVFLFVFSLKFYFISFLILFLYCGAISIIFIFTLMITNTKIVLKYKNRLNKMKEFFVYVFFYLIIFFLLFYYSVDFIVENYFLVDEIEYSILYFEYFYKFEDEITMLGILLYNYNFLSFILISNIMLSSTLCCISIVITKANTLRFQLSFEQIIDENNISLFNQLGLDKNDLSGGVVKCSYKNLKKLFSYLKG